MMKTEWLKGKKESCERGIVFYQNKINALKKDLEVINSLLETEEEQPADVGYTEEVFRWRENFKNNPEKMEEIERLMEEAEEKLHLPAMGKDICIVN